MFLTHVVDPVVNRGNFGSSCLHHVYHDFRYIYLIMPLEWLSLPVVWLSLLLFVTLLETLSFFYSTNLVIRFFLLNWSHASFDK